MLVCACIFLVHVIVYVIICLWTQQQWVHQDQLARIYIYIAHMYGLSFDGCFLCERRSELLKIKSKVRPQKEKVAVDHEVRVCMCVSVWMSSSRSSQISDLKMSCHWSQTGCVCVMFVCKWEAEDTHTHTYLFVECFFNHGRGVCVQVRTCRYSHIKLLFLRMDVLHRYKYFICVRVRTYTRIKLSSHTTKGFVGDAPLTYTHRHTYTYMYIIHTYYKMS